MPLGTPDGGYGDGMPGMTSQHVETPEGGPPEGFEGHSSIGYDCLMCGAQVRAKHVCRHLEWHDKVDHIVSRVRGQG
jgi:hypothetical protein